MIHRIRARLRNLRSQWCGYIEGICDGQIRCWVYSRRQPETPVEVEILFCGESIARIAADEDRRDVATAIGLRVSPGCSVSLRALSDDLRETLARKLQKMAGETVSLRDILSVRVSADGSLLPFTAPAAKQRHKRASLLALLGARAKANSLSDVEAIRQSAWFDAAWYAKEYPDQTESGMEPAQHYLRIGAMLGRNPSAAFDGAAYLARYPQVAGKGLNPLVHFEKWGRENGFRPFPLFLKGADAAPDAFLHAFPGGEVDVLISCWLERPEALHNGFSEIIRALRGAGLTSQMLCPPGPISDLLREQGIDALIPETFSVIRSPNLLSNPGKAPSLAPQIASQVIRRDIEFFPSRHFSPEKRKKLVRKCGQFYSFWRDYLVSRRVKFFLIWGNTAPTSRIFIQLCQELGIEYLVLERGHFSGTLHADLLGQFAYGASLRGIGKLLAGRATAALPSPERMREIEEWGLKLLTPAEDAQTDGPAARQITEEKAQGRRIILMLGANDQGSGLLSPELGMAKLAWFGNSPAAFDQVAAVMRAKFPEARLVVRPHPSQQYTPDDDVILACEEPLEWLIAQADVCISISSTVYALCLLAKKPLLHFGAMDSLFSAIGRQIRDETEVLPALRELIWGGCAPNYSEEARAQHLCGLFNDKLIAVNSGIPARISTSDLGEAIAARTSLARSGSHRRFNANHSRISRALYEDISTRARMAFTPDPAAPRRPISVVMPIYSDYEGTDRAFALVAKYRAVNDNYRVILVWDRGPDERLLELCRSAVTRYGFELLENVTNVGFSGSVNRGIDHAGRDDVILLNSDTVICDDWALRLQAAAHAHPKLAAVVPFSNNATIYNLPFPEGVILPPDPFRWVQNLDRAARNMPPCVIEMPVAHGFCIYIRRVAFDRIGLFDEMAFGIGQGEDNDFSLRLRGAGFMPGCATNVFVGHDGGTSFGEDAMAWKLSGRKVMNAKYPYYMDEIRAFLADDPLAGIRRHLLQTAAETEIDTSRKPYLQMSMTVG